MVALSLYQEQILNQEGGPPVPERNLESLQDGGMIPSFCQDENLSTKRVFLPYPWDCGLFCTSTSRDFFSSKKATDSTRRRKEGCRFYNGEFLRRLRKKSLGEDSLLLSGQEITRELSFFLPGFGDFNSVPARQKNFSEF